MRAVSTKYLQKYLNWQRIKDLFKDTAKWIKTVLALSLQKADAITILLYFYQKHLLIFKYS